MNKTELLTRFAPDEENRLVLARLLDKAETARTRSIPASTHFLTPGQRALGEQVIAASGHPRHLFYGGWPQAERTVCLFLPDWAELEEGDLLPPGIEDPLAAVETPILPGSGLTHRDFLGALMGLGIERDLIGDILVGEDKGQVIVLRRALHILLTQWDQVGRYGAKPREIPLDRLEPVEAKVTVLHETFQSLRFDAVAAAAFRIPRAKAASLISSGRLDLNHQPCEKPDRLLTEGDVLTGRGFGKCVLARVTGQSRKGRIMAELERYT